VQNVIAGGCSIETPGRTRQILSVEVVGRAASWAHLPLLVRLAIRVFRVHEFLLLSVKRDTSL